MSTGTCNWLWLCWTAKWFKARMQCVTFSHLIQQHTTRSSAFIWRTFGGFNFMKLTYPHLLLWSGFIELLVCSLFLTCMLVHASSQMFSRATPLIPHTKTPSQDPEFFPRSPSQLSASVSLFSVFPRETQ